ncbi:MAG: class I tRNA ligase family protein, partial [Oscillospiraceae bacterium]|nr:class I tRNA ligase family protein [Oscillospiraceae bacterium]
VIVSKTDVHTCPKCNSTNLKQDEDTLDTWFSSALWPFSTLGWPDKNAEDFSFFYPTNTLVTGYDIIFFWVARMLFSGIEHAGQPPFDTVFIHGLVRDAQGRKMSKSLGNGIDPLEVIAEFGADALRFTLVNGSTAGNDTRYSAEKITASRNFANKLWNAARFVLMNVDETLETGLPDQLDLSDKWVLSKLNSLAKDMTENIDKYELGLAAAKVNEFIWDVFCDWYIEIAKIRLNGDNAEEANNARRVLVYVLAEALKLLHPFMPFISEEIYSALPGTQGALMMQSWPVYSEALNFAAEETVFNNIMDLIKAVRTIRTEMNVHPTKRTRMFIETQNTADFEQGDFFIKKFAFASEIEIGQTYTGSTEGTVQVVTHAARGFIPMMELIDREKEQARLEKELAACEKDIAQLAGKANNENFVAKAPAKVVEEIKEKLAKAEDKKAKILESIAALG